MNSSSVAMADTSRSAADALRIRKQLTIRPYIAAQDDRRARFAKSTTRFRRAKASRSASPIVDWRRLDKIDPIRDPAAWFAW